MPHPDSEEALELETIALFEQLGYPTAIWEYFSDWKKINSEGEEGIISLDTMIRGTCDTNKLLDIVENFTLFSEEQGGLIKLVAKNRQYLGVNSAIEAVQNIRENQGKLGVFCHTQGSGKSFSMQFFSQKVHRKVQEKWTFVIITDREDLDDQSSDRKLIETHVLSPYGETSSM